MISEELAVEDRLNDEVRDLLSQYSEYMRREGVSYQEMFRRIKNTLISQRKVIRASGRDTGDPMKLSRDKVSEISHKVVEMLRKNRDLRLKNKDTNAIRLEIVRVMTELLLAEDKVDRAARAEDPLAEDATSPKAAKSGICCCASTTPKNSRSSASISPSRRATPAPRASAIP